MASAVLVAFYAFDVQHQAAFVLRIALAVLLLKENSSRLRSAVTDTKRMSFSRNDASSFLKLFQFNVSFHLSTASHK